MAIGITAVRIEHMLPELKFMLALPANDYSSRSLTRIGPDICPSIPWPVGSAHSGSRHAGERRGISTWKR